MFFLAAVPFMYCDAPSAVVTIRKAVDATHAGAGHVTLADGASFEVTKPDDDSFVVRLRKADRVQVCYAPQQRFADAGPSARMAIAGNARTGDYVYSLAYPAKKVAAFLAMPQRGVAAALAPVIAPRAQSLLLRAYTGSHLHRARQLRLLKHDEERLRRNDAHPTLPLT